MLLLVLDWVSGRPFGELCLVPTVCSPANVTTSMVALGDVAKDAVEKMTGEKVTAKH